MIRKSSILVVTLFGWTAFGQNSATPTETIRGCLSDNHCAASKARDDVYAAINPECAKESLGKGYKIVLIDPQQTRVLFVTDQETAKRDLGNYVEVTGEIDPQTNTIKTESIKFLAKVTWPPPESDEKQ